MLALLAKQHSTLDQSATAYQHSALNLLHSPSLPGDISLYTNRRTWGLAAFNRCLQLTASEMAIALLTEALCPRKFNLSKDALRISMQYCISEIATNSDISCLQRQDLVQKAALLGWLVNSQLVKQSRTSQSVPNPGRGLLEDTNKYQIPQLHINEQLQQAVSGIANKLQKEKAVTYKVDAALAHGAERTADALSATYFLYETLVSKREQYASHQQILQGHTNPLCYPTHHVRQPGASPSLSQVKESVFPHYHMLTKEEWVQIGLLVLVNGVRRNPNGKLQPKSMQLTAAKMSWMLAKTPQSGKPLPVWLVCSQWYPGKPLPTELANIPQDQEHPEFTAIYNSDYLEHIKEMKMDIQIKKATTVFRPSTALLSTVDNLFGLCMTGITGAIAVCQWVAATEDELAWQLVWKIWGKPQLLIDAIKAGTSTLHNASPSDTHWYACIAPVIPCSKAGKVKQPIITAAVEDEAAQQPTSPSENQVLSMTMSQELGEGSVAQHPADTTEMKHMDETAMCPLNFYLSASFTNGDKKEDVPPVVRERALMSSLSATLARAAPGSSSSSNNNNESSPGLVSSKPVGLQHGSEQTEIVPTPAEISDNQEQDTVNNPTETAAPKSGGVDSVTPVTAPNNANSNININQAIPNCTTNNKGFTKKPSFLGRAWRAVTQFVEDTRAARTPLTEEQLEGMQSYELIN